MRLLQRICVVVLCLSLAAFGFGLDQPQAPLPLASSASDPRNRTVSASLFAELEELARIVDITYCVGLTGLGISKPFKCASRCNEFPGFELITAWNTGPLLSDSCGFIALSHRPEPRIIIAFRGTYSLTNTIVDLSTIPQEYVPYPGEDDSPNVKPPRCDNCAVHSGFYKSWINTRDQILHHVLLASEMYPHYKLTLVGHSLGGAVAALAALDFRSRGWDPHVTTFGEPRVGNHELAHYIDNRFNLTANMNVTESKFRRVTHMGDPVPLLPVEEWGYRMHGGEIFIGKPDLPPIVGDVHHCSGDEDEECIAGDDPRAWVPARFKLWQLFWAHRDYFWRLGLCVPGGDPWNWKGWQAGAEIREEDEL
ncbi:Alpha/Beta hydrolase protein [Phyllosticta citrichinensis]|uniref:Alpha/Beta hydrolase protein n=1 Tax=Phyllosticta citrichinensis TaxID=1130410 RepID=A0ABR1Y480_9PEZI